MDKITKLFPSLDYKDTMELITAALDELFKLREDKLSSHLCDNSNTSNIVSFESENDIKKIPQLVNTDLKKECKYLVSCLKNCPNYSSAKHMVNVIPPTTNICIVSSLLSAITNSNIIEEELAGDGAKLELKVISMLSDLYGYNEQSIDDKKLRGCFTFGGTGNYLYALHTALCKIPDYQTNGFMEKKIKIMTSIKGHYVKATLSNWTSIGTNNVINIQANEFTNEMDLKDLKEQLIYCAKNKIIVPFICATMGTTDAFAFDDIFGIKKVIEEVKKEYDDFFIPFVYADSVIGWSQLFFKDYDFKENALNLSKEALNLIKNNLEKLKCINQADAIGIDFHKTGFSSYICSCVVFRDPCDFDNIKRTSEDTAYLCQSTCTTYFPGLSTLEVSRPFSYIAQAYGQLVTLGVEGYRILIGQLMEEKVKILNYVSDFNDIKEFNFKIAIANKQNTGIVTLLRLYNKEINSPDEEYTQELKGNVDSIEIDKRNKIQCLIFDILEYIRTKNNSSNDCPLFIGITKKCNYYYDKKENKKKAIVALKFYPMSPFTKLEDVHFLLRKYFITYANLIFKEICNNIIKIGDEFFAMSNNHIIEKIFLGKIMDDMIKTVKDIKI